MNEEQSDRRRKNEKEQDDIGIDFRQSKKKRQNEHDELFLKSIVATTTSLAICLAKYFISIDKPIGFFRWSSPTFSQKQPSEMFCKNRCS